MMCFWASSMGQKVFAGRSSTRCCGTHICNFLKVVHNACLGKLPFPRRLSAHQTLFCGTLLHLAPGLQALRQEAPIQSRQVAEEVTLLCCACTTRYVGTTRHLRFAPT